MGLSPIIELIPQDYYQKIHDASMQILKKKGIIYHSVEALEVFKKHGAKVENETVYFNDKLIEDIIGNCRPKFVWKAREPKNTLTVGEDFIVQPNIGPVFIQEMDKTRRPGLLKDFINFQKLCQAIDTIDVTGTSPVDADDVAPNVKHLHMMFEAIKVTNKPLIGYVNGTGIVRKTLDMVELVVGGKNEFESNHYVGIGVNPLSPLKWAPEVIETIIEYSKRNQAVFVLPCILAGVSGPISLMETAILQNAEILSGIALVKLVNPSAAVVYAPGSTAAYMKTASYCTGTPEGLMLNIANVQMGRDFYKLPTRTMSGMTDAKYPDFQAGAETMQNLMLGILGGANIVLEVLGTLDSLMASSYEKLILDVELIERVKRIRQRFQGFDVSFSTEAILEVDHGNSFLEHNSTYEHFRSRWTPSISDWDAYENWEGAGKPDINAAANRKWKAILATAPDCLLEPEQLKALEDYFSNALKF